MRRLLLYIMLGLMMIAYSCGHPEKTLTEKQNVTEILSPYDGFSVTSKTIYKTDDGRVCALQLSKTIDSSRYTYYVDSLPEWVWDEYYINDTINTGFLREPENPPINKDSTGRKIIMVNGMEYELTEIYIPD